MPIIPGLPVMFYSRGNALDASIKKLNALLDKNGATVKTRPKVSINMGLFEILFFANLAVSCQIRESLGKLGPSSGQVRAN